MVKKAGRRIRYEVLPEKDGGWSVTRDRVVTGRFITKAGAVEYAAGEGRRAWAKGLPAQLFIKGRDGRIQDERTYGNDPRHIPG
ncbi:DUF2188 domain-containing protein [Luteimonas sp. MJ174]|uniref:DUF2188 domain-containing protein n=1 Tax=Luteimonas sp. MJ174 TaxID=3129237 RepID=UPI0031B9CC08